MAIGEETNAVEMMPGIHRRHRLFFTADKMCIV